MISRHYHKLKIVFALKYIRSKKTASVALACLSELGFTTQKFMQLGCCYPHQLVEGLA